MSQLEPVFEYEIVYVDEKTFPVTCTKIKRYNIKDLKDLIVEARMKGLTRKTKPLVKWIFDDALVDYNKIINESKTRRRLNKITVIDHRMIG